MSFQAEVSMLAGVLATVLMCALVLAAPVLGESRASSKGSLRLGWGRMILILGAVHVFFMGYAGWMTPQDWPGYMPPITIISFVVAIVFLVRRRKSVQE